MNRVFLDTVGLLAIWDADDQWHQAATEAYRSLATERVVFITTSFVLAECGNAAARRPYRKMVVELRRALETRGQLIFPEIRDWQGLWLRYSQEPSGSAGIVDQLSFTVMRRLGLQRAFTNDRHFREAGFTILF